MPPKAKVSQMNQQVPLSAHVISAFFEGSDAKATEGKVAQLESSRLSYLFRFFPHSSVDAIKSAIKEYKADEKKKAGGEKIPATASARASNIQTLYGAWRFAEFKPEGMGFQKAYTASVEALKAKGLKWDGGRIPEAWEKDVKKRVETDAQVALAVEMEREQYRRTHNGDDPPADFIEQKRLQTADAIAKAGAVNMAGKLFEKQGADFCGWLVEALEGLISAHNEATAEQKPQEHKAA